MPKKLLITCFLILAMPIFAKASTTSCHWFLNNWECTTEPSFGDTNPQPQQQPNQPQTSPTLTCGVGTVLSNSQCVSYDTFCAQHFGSGSQYSGTDSTGRIGCQCKTGYSSNQNNTSCVASQPSLGNSDVSICQQQHKLSDNGVCKTRDEICQAAHGPLSISVIDALHYTWSVNITNSLKYEEVLCGCQPNSQPDSGNNTCVPKKNAGNPRVTTPGTTSSQEVTPSAKPNQPVTGRQSKPSFFRRVINWFKNLF